MCNKLISLPAVNTVSLPPQSLDWSSRDSLALSAVQAGRHCQSTNCSRAQPNTMALKKSAIFGSFVQKYETKMNQYLHSQVSVASLNILNVPSLKFGTLCWASLLCSYENDDWTSADFSPSRPSTIWSTALAMPPILYSLTSSRLLELDGVGFSLRNLELPFRSLPASPITPQPDWAAHSAPAHTRPWGRTSAHAHTH